MLVIKPDHDRRIAIPGLPAPVRRPVDIDQTTTGFAILRTLRIYRFDKESVIEGHAEEDEVFLVVIAGSVELTILDTGLDLSTTLSTPEGAGSVAFAAYLPPHAAYKLVATTDAEVAYARATPFGTRPARVFCSAARLAANGVTVLLEETAYADRLRLRMLRFDAREQDAMFAPVSRGAGEALVHMRIHSSEAVAVIRNATSSVRPESVWLQSWETLADTFAATAGDDLTVHIAKGLSGLALIVTAT